MKFDLRVNLGSNWVSGCLLSLLALLVDKWSENPDFVVVAMLPCTLCYGFKNQTIKHFFFHFDKIAEIVHRYWVLVSNSANIHSANGLN